MRVVVAMSGGVDSSAAAALLVEQGHEVLGITLRVWSYEGAARCGSCCSPDDIDDARAVASALGGSIALTSRLGTGTRIEVRLPRAAAASAVENVPRMVSVLKPGGGPSGPVRSAG